MPKNGKLRLSEAESSLLGYAERKQFNKKIKFKY